MKRKAKDNRISRRRGQAALELALVLPILVLLAALIIQYSILMNTAAAITNLSREGARLAVSAQAGDTAIKSRITDVDNNYGVVINNSDITVTPADNTSRTVAGTLVTVSISYDMSKKLFLPSKMFGMTLYSNNFVGQTTMMMQPK